MPKSYTELIHCANCGEDFAATYRRCPFCNAKPGQRAERDEAVEYDEPTGEVEYEPVYDEPPMFRASGGKRLQRGGGGGGGYRRGGFPWGKIALYTGTALVILAAVWIITVKLLPIFFPAKQSQAPSPSPSDTVSAAPSPTVPAVVTEPPVDPTDPAVPTVPVVAVTDAPSVTDTPSDSPAPAGSLTLSSVDFTLSPKWPTYQMKVTGATGKVTYSIGSPSVATVSDAGLVTAVANGWTVLTVTDEAGATAKCDVRVSGMPKAQAPADSGNSGGNSGSSSDNTSAGGAKLSTTDFTLSQKLGYTAQLTVSGGTAASWSSSNQSVATVSSSGLVTGVSKGTATITCTLTDGTTLTSIARVH